MRYKNYDCFDFEAFRTDLHKARWGRGMTMHTVGLSLRKSKATISRWEAGKTIPTVTDFLLVCWFFELNPLDYFVNPARIEKSVTMFGWDDAIDISQDSNF